MAGITMHRTACSKNINTCLDKTVMSHCHSKGRVYRDTWQAFTSINNENVARNIFRRFM